MPHASPLPSPPAFPHLSSSLCPYLASIIQVRIELCNRILALNMHRILPSPPPPLLCSAPRYPPSPSPHTRFRPSPSFISPTLSSPSPMPGINDEKTTKETTCTRPREKSKRPSCIPRTHETCVLGHREEHFVWWGKGATGVVAGYWWRSDRRLKVS